MRTKVTYTYLFSICFLLEEDEVFDFVFAGFLSHSVATAEIFTA